MVGASADVGSLFEFLNAGKEGSSGVVKGITYIENDNSVVGPLNADLAVLRAGEMVEKEFEQGVAFFLFEADDAFRV